MYNGLKMPFLANKLLVPQREHRKIQCKYNKLSITKSTGQMQIINGKISNRTLLTNNGHVERQPINYSKNNLLRVNLNCAILQREAVEHVFNY